MTADKVILPDVWVREDLDEFTCRYPLDDFLIFFRKNAVSIQNDLVWSWLCAVQSRTGIEMTHFSAYKYNGTIAASDRAVVSLIAWSGFRGAHVKTGGTYFSLFWHWMVG